MDSTKELFRDNLRDSHWLGEVIDNNDPDNLGRCKIKVFGKFDLIEPEFIPWADPANRISTGFHAVPRVGEVIGVRFNNGNIYQPEYFYNVVQNSNLKSEVLDSSAAPQNVVSLLYDADRNIRIFWSPEDGLVVTTGSNKDAQPMIRFSVDGKMFLNADNIFIASNTSDETQPAVKGQTLVDVLNKIIEEMKIHVHPAPATPPQPTHILQWSIAQKQLETVKQKK